MVDANDNRGAVEKLKCPECRAELKRRRSRQPDACEMVCGGCGQMFDVCDTDTVAQLKKRRLDKRVADG